MERAAFKITPEYVAVLGGKGSPLYEEFADLFAKGLAAARKYASVTITMIEIMMFQVGLVVLAEPSTFVVIFGSVCVDEMLSVRRACSGGRGGLTSRWTDAVGGDVNLCGLAAEFLWQEAACKGACDTRLLALTTCT